MDKLVIDESSYRLAIDLHERALVVARAGNLRSAIHLLQQAVLLSPTTTAIHANLGVMQLSAGDPGEAVASLLRALQIEPTAPPVLNNLANALTAAGQPDEAVIAAERSLQLQPEQAEAFNALGNAFKEQGRIAAAMAAFERGARLRPDLNQLASNRLYTAHFSDGMSPKRLLEMHRQWGGQFDDAATADSLPKRSLGRRDRLRIGYVSPDLCDHPVGRFILPLLRTHDWNRFSIYAYSGVTRPDLITDQIRTRVKHWRDVAPLTDEALAARIRQDGIDILVDLSLHMRGHRLLTFARRAAPVQVTYLGYCSTSGLRAMGYRFTDALLDPEVIGRDELYSEKSMRLPGGYWCYEPPAAPAVSVLPCATAGHVTFGCLNNFCKVTDGTLATWRSILQSVPASRLILHAGAGSQRDRVIDRLGVSPERVEFVARVPHAEYLRLYHRIDIALDPMPCNGGTTTCDALWMGVPVVSLAGETAVSRSGLSILSTIGLADWVAKTPKQYAALAVEFADDWRGLEALRRSMRKRMKASPLMNVTAYARAVEHAYRKMWESQG